MMAMMRSLFITLLLISVSRAQMCRNSLGDVFNGGACYLATHTFTHPLRTQSTAWKNNEDIKEFHFHTYWFQNRPTSVAAARRLQNELIEAVGRGQFVAIMPGMTQNILPLEGLIEAEIPNFNDHPVGPHPGGSFETWVPREYLGDVMSFFMQRRGELSVFFHPLSRWENEDHGARSMWLGPPMRLDHTVLQYDLGAPPAQYTGLKLGYSAPEHQF